MTDARPAAVHRFRAAPVTVSAWVVLVAAGGVLVHAVRARDVRLHAPPLAGFYEPQLGPGLAAAMVAGALVAAFGPRIAARARWRVLLVATGVAAAGWAVVVAGTEGVDGLTGPVLHPKDYLADVPLVGSPRFFLTTFTDRIEGYTVHTQGHPPGLVLLLWGLGRVGLSGGGWTAALFVAGGALAVPAALVAMREVAGEEAARRAAPFVALAPVAVWVASSGDALFAGVSAWAVTLVILATGRGGARADALAVGGGVLFGVSAFLSYGLVLVAVVPVVVAVHRRRVRALAVAALGALPVFGAFAAAGFWWVDGLLATRDRYFAGVGGRRPYVVFLVADLAALAIALGPAGAAALTRLRGRRAWLLPGAALAAVALAALSGMSKGEVERIWLPFTPWLLLAGAALAARSRARASAWLGVQATATLAVQAAVRTPW